MIKTKQSYKVTHPNCTPFTVFTSSPQSACRRAFKYWIKQGELKKQPKTTDDGGFEGVTVYT